MSAKGDDALTALRNWSQPDQRDRLIAAAWTAGETRITALAEASRTSRPTVYRALRNQGINPSSRPQEDSMKNATPIELDSMTGLNAVEVLMAVDRWKNQNPGATEEETLREIARTRPVFYALYVYNTLRPELARETAARSERDRMLHLVKTRWEALSSSPHWLAAHHAYVVAVDEARTALKDWREVATSAARTGSWPDSETRDVYRNRILAAGHPAVEPLDSKTVTREADRLSAEFEETYTHRKTLLEGTLRSA